MEAPEEHRRQVSAEGRDARRIAAFAARFDVDAGIGEPRVRGGGTGVLFFLGCAILCRIPGFPVFR
ncbi:hypothetical protein NCF_03099 [Burkholderia pseudomallei]|uniref:hypothetical protein n=1 Tax=Burkholderia pseudomallei TaxID=28450 RepID=UPI0005313010|nr:hypothetical protein [Burkholderia pseudomallei]KGS52928.1 hypothetical protein X949_1689 [Burkholderia pseudomallei MSHR5609]